MTAGQGIDHANRNEIAAGDGAVFVVGVVGMRGQGQQADVLITGGTIYDGSAAKPFTGDVAITGDKIVYVGPKATM